MEHVFQRIRHDLKLRIASVVTSERITPRMARITLHSPEFADFTSDAYDDHVKLFFPPEGSELALPVAGPNGLTFPDGERPIGRDYTPRSFDRERCEVVIDFVLHGDGPAASWALEAKAGDRIGVGGPRSSFVLTRAFDWYLLIGDESALPAIGRRIEELPEGAKAVAIIEVADSGERQAFATPADLDLHWVERDQTHAPGVIETLRATALPDGTGYAFIAGEASLSAALRRLLLEELGFDQARVKSAGYWRLGEADFHDGHQH